MKILYFYQATGSIYAFCFIAVISSVSNLLSQDFTNMQKQDLFDIGGNIGGSLSFSDYGGSYSQQSPWSSVISAGLHMKLAGIDVPLSFTYVDGKSSYMHPFTRYGLSPRYKNYTLHLGYRSMNLSSSVFSGKTYYGLGSEINFDNVKLALFYGEIEQARAYDSAFAGSYMRRWNDNRRTKWLLWHRTGLRISSRRYWITNKNIRVRGKV